MFNRSHNLSLIILSAFIYIAILVTGCSNAQNQNIKTNLQVQEFSDKIKELPNAPIIDVRTPEEFGNGHLANAINYNWNGENFEKEIANLDKSKPVLVYCLSGGRSGSAASKMRSMGFKEVYEMAGGMMKWRAANLPETTDTGVKKPGMTLADYQKMLASDKIILVDFYADWCVPCKKMKPYLDEISTEMAATVQVIRINADDNVELMKELKVDALPVLKVYSKGQETWNNIGFVPKEEVVAHLK
ncbi:MAG: redoxin family protein [Bacteroidia bacterium]|nr:redoxin family protein [Bacteroidia bacterium]